MCSAHDQKVVSSISVRKSFLDRETALPCICSIFTSPLLSSFKGFFILLRCHGHNHGKILYQGMFLDLAWHVQLLEGIWKQVQTHRSQTKWCPALASNRSHLPSHWQGSTWEGLLHCEHNTVKHTEEASYKHSMWEVNDNMYEKLKNMEKYYSKRTFTYTLLVRKCKWSRLSKVWHYNLIPFTSRVHVESNLACRSCQNISRL